MKTENSVIPKRPKCGSITARTQRFDFVNTLQFLIHSTISVPKAQ